MSGPDIPWENLIIGRCYQSSNAYRGMADQDEYIGELMTQPTRQEVQNLTNPNAQWGRGNFSIWSADFKKTNITLRRYQTRDPNGNNNLGFFFKEVPCEPTEENKALKKQALGELKSLPKEGSFPGGINFQTALAKWPGSSGGRRRNTKKRKRRGSRRRRRRN